MRSGEGCEVDGVDCAEEAALVENPEEVWLDPAKNKLEMSIYPMA